MIRGGCSIKNKKTPFFSNKKIKKTLVCKYYSLNDENME